MKSLVFSTLVLALAYWIFAGDMSTTEAVALGVSLVAAVGLAAASRRVAARYVECRAPWVRLVLRTLLSIAKDSLKVGFKLMWLTLGRGTSTGTVGTQAFNVGNDSPVAAGRRALVTLAISASPDRFVIDVIPPQGLVTHSLVGGASNTDRDWPV